MKDADFSKILDLLNDNKSFKSIIYRKNEFGTDSQRFLSRMLEKKVPNHLHELRIENCKVVPEAIEFLVESLAKLSAVSLLGLVNANMTADTFKNLAKYAKNSQYLTELDVSDNIQLSQETYSSFLKNISKSKILRDLNISHNKLMGDEYYDDKSYKHLKRLVTLTNIQHL